MIFMLQALETGKRNLDLKYTLLQKKEILLSTKIMNQLEKIRRLEKKHKELLSANNE